MLGTSRRALWMWLLLTAAGSAQEKGSAYLQMAPLPPLLMSAGPNASGLAKNSLGSKSPDLRPKKGERLAELADAWRKASSDIELLRNDGAVQLKGHTGGVTSLAWSPDGKWLASGSEDSTARLWNTATGEALHVFEGHGHPVRNVLFSPDGRLLVSGGGFTRSRQLLIPHVIDDVKQEIVPLGLGYAALGGLSPVEARPTSRRLFVWDVATGKRRYLWSAEAPLMMTWFSPEGERCYATDTDRNIMAWSVATGEPVVTWKLPSALLDAMFSPDGKTLYTLSDNENIVRAWDADGKAVSVLKMPGLSLARRGILLEITLDGKFLKVELAWKPTEGVRAFNAMRVPAALTFPFASEALLSREGDLYLWELPATQGVYYRNANDAKLAERGFVDAVAKGGLLSFRRR